MKKTIKFNQETGMLDAVKRGIKKQTCLELSEVQKKVLEILEFRVESEKGGEKLSWWDKYRLHSGKKHPDSYLHEIKTITANKLYFSEEKFKDGRIVYYTCGIPVGFSVSDWQDIHKYQVGDVLAVVESYLIDNRGGKHLESESDIYTGLIVDSDGFTTNEWIELGYEDNIWLGFIYGNPDKFPSELAETFVKITGISVQKPCDFTEEQLINEGLINSPDRHKGFLSGMRVELCGILQAIYGKEQGSQLFESEMLVLTFELCDKEGRVLE